MPTNSKNSKTVLLVMDIQKVMIDYMTNPEPFVTKIEKAIVSARNAGVTVVYVTQAFRESHPEKGTSIHQAIKPLPTDIIVQKKRVSAFTASDLETILHAHKAESLVLSGFSTTRIVFSTLREGTDRDYHMTVLSDACADPEQEVHDYLVKEVFPFSGEVLTTDEVHDYLVKKVFPFSGEVLTTDEWVTTLN
jgi:nicotinamidase-related amidase